MERRGEGEKREREGKREGWEEWREEIGSLFLRRGSRGRLGEGKG